MRNIYDRFTNKGLVLEGVFLELGELEDGRKVRLRVRHSGGANRAHFLSVSDHVYKPHRERKEKITVEVQDKCLQQIYARACVVSWENILDENGQEIPYSTANVLKLFEEIPELFESVVEISDEKQHYMQVEEDAKN